MSLLLLLGCLPSLPDEKPAADTAVPPTAEPVDLSCVVTGTDLAVRGTIVATSPIEKASITVDASSAVWAEYPETTTYEVDAVVDGTAWADGTERTAALWVRLADLVDAVQVGTCTFTIAAPCGDADRDTFADAACGGDDCDDGDADVSPGAFEACNDRDDDCDAQIDEDPPTWAFDGDADGYGDDEVSVVQCDAPTGFVATGGDCDDDDAAVHPGADEADCTDPTDYNCDGSVGYADADGDGFAACVECDDDDAGIRPDASESCDDVDEDCDGAVDDDATDAPEWYDDDDGDAYGGASAGRSCDAPAGAVVVSGDCDDASAEVHPGVDDPCDESDNDCDGEIDEDPNQLYLLDADGDGWGDSASPAYACGTPEGYSSSSGDCADDDAAIHPGVDDGCDEVDSDCDGSTDDDPDITWYADADGDGLGDAGETRASCDQPADYLADDTDCDDADNTVGAASEWFTDADGDGYGAESAGFACDAPADAVAEGGDCDDSDATAFPTASAEAASDLDCNGCIAYIEDDFEDGGAGGLVADDTGWECFGDECTSVYSASPVSSGTMAVSLAGGSGEIGQESAGLADDFVLALDFYDAGGAGNLEILLGTSAESPLMWAGFSSSACTGYCAWSSDDGYVGLGERKTGWHELTVRAVYAEDGTGTASVTIDADSTEVGLAAAVGTLWFNDDDTADSIDQVRAFGAGSGTCAADIELTWYADADGDGYGDPESSLSDRSWPDGYVANASDCHDGDASASPATHESCNGYDDDCDGEIDDGDVCSAPYLPSATSRYALALAEGGSGTVTVASSDDWEVCAGDPFTLELWASVEYDTTGGGWQDLVWMGAFGGDSFALRTNGSSTRFALHWNSSTTGDVGYEPSAPTLGTWHFFAIQFASDGTPSVWVDGVELGGSVTTKLTGCITAGTLSLGGATGYEKNGTYGWARVSDVARYSSTYVGVPSELRVDEHTLAAWSMEQSTGASVTDESGRGHDGTVSGTYSWTLTSY